MGFSTIHSLLGSQDHGGQIWFGDHIEVCFLIALPFLVKKETARLSSESMDGMRGYGDLETGEL